MRIIGVEGHFSADSPVTWGAAVIDEGDRIVNSFTRRSCLAGDLERLLGRGAITRLSGELGLPSGNDGRGVVVLVINKDHTLHHSFLPDLNRDSGILTKYLSQNGQSAFVFSNKSRFLSYVKYTSNTIIGKCLLGSVAGESQDKLLSYSLIIDPRNPILLALRVVNAPNERRTRLEHLASSLLGNDENLVEPFQSMIAACTGSRDELTYRIKYEDGVAEGGGLDVDVAANQLRAIDQVAKKVRPLVLDKYPFLAAAPDVKPRLGWLETGSASLNLCADVEGASLVERVYRYFELQELQDVLQDNIPDRLSRDHDFQKHVEKIIHPTDDTRTYYTLLGSSTQESASFQPVPQEGGSYDVSLAMLGFIIGIRNTVKKVEIKLFPRESQRLSIVDNGSGETPAGANIFKERNDCLFRPAYYRVSRYSDVDHERFCLSEISLLTRSSPHFKLNSFPSSVLPGAFVINQNMRIRLEEGAIWIDEDCAFRLHGQYTLAHVTEVIDSYAEWCRQREFSLADSKESRWLRPLKTKLSAAMKIVLALHKLRQEKSSLSTIIEYLIDNFQHKGPVRRNNTRKYARTLPRYISFNEDDIFTLTPQGVIYARILDRILRSEGA